MTHNEIYLKDLEMAASQSLPWEKLRGQSILVTGATGLIGSCFIDLCMTLNKKYDLGLEVYANSRNQAKLERKFKEYLSDSHFHILAHDVKEPLLEDFHFDYIVHAACTADPKVFGGDPVETIRTNIDGVVNLLEYGRNHAMKRFLFLSSAEVYGDSTKSDQDFKETDLGYINCNMARACYPESKRLAETYCAIYHDKYNLDVVIARPSRIYGPTYQEGDSKAIFQFIEKTVNGEDIVLKSEGNQIFSFCYVVDTALALFYILLEGASSQAYNVTNDEQELTLKEIAEYLTSLSNKKVVFELPNEVEKKGYSGLIRSTLNIDKLKTLGFQPLTSMKEGLKKTVRILREERP